MPPRCASTAPAAPPSPFHPPAIHTTPLPPLPQFEKYDAEHHIRRDMVTHLQAAFPDYGLK